jgi:hypothetical protein
LLGATLARGQSAGFADAPSVVCLRAMLSQLSSRPLPARPPLRVLLGPGLVWMALAQGSGELIFWPQMIAKYGLAFLFLLVPACLLQFPVTFEIGRYTTLTGEGIFAGFFRLSRPLGFLIWVLFTLSFLWFGAFASAGSTAIASLTGFPGSWEISERRLFWAQALIVLFTVALLYVRTVYRLIEWVMKVVALVSLGGMIIACLHPEVRAQLGTFARGIVIPDFVAMRSFDIEHDAERLLTAVVFAGLGGFWTLFYSYWLKEKGIGMASAGSAALPAADPESAVHLKSWLRYLSLESLVGIAGNLITTLLSCLLAFALLHPRHLVPEGEQIAVVQGEFFAHSWGEWGRLLFLFIAGAFLADTWLATADCVSRIQLEVLSILSPRIRALDPRRAYHGMVLGLALVTSVTMYLKQPETLIILSAVIGFTGTVIYCFMLIALNHFRLNSQLAPALRSSRASLAAIVLVTLIYLALACTVFWLRAPVWWAQLFH